MVSSRLLRWRAGLEGFSTWLDSRWRSHFRLLPRCAPQNGIGTSSPRRLTRPCPCPTDPPPPAAALHRTAALTQGAPLLSRKTVTALRWGEDTKPKLLRRRGTDRGWRGQTCLELTEEGVKGGEHEPERLTPRSPSPLDRFAEIYGKILNWNKRQLDLIRQTNQPLSSSAVAVAEQNPNKVGWGRETREATEKEEKGDSWSQTVCQKKKKRSEALPQMRHSCKSDSQTLAETLPSFLGWRKLRSLTHTPFSLVSLRLLSPQALQNPGIKKRRLYSLSLSFF